MRLLAVSSPERLATAPEIPTLIEKGLPFVRFGWLGVCVGLGTPQPIVSLLNRHIVGGAVRRVSRDGGEGCPIAQTARISREFGLQL